MRDRVAILIPAYNAATYLPDLFAGVAAQTVPFDQILCYDDNSSDDTVAVARAFGATVLRGNTNRGAAYARNRLIDAADSHWIHFHDADDLIDPTFVERMMSTARPGTVVLCGMQVRDRTTRELVGRVSYIDLRTAADPVSYFIDHTGYPSLGLYPRAALLEIGGFREDLRGDEDPDLHVRLAHAGFPFTVEGAELSTNLMHGESFSANNRLRCLQDRLRCLHSYAEWNGDHLSVVGRQALKLAWLLFDAGDRLAAADAIDLARRCGTRTMDSHRPVTRLISRTLGPRTVFRLRSWLWPLRRRWRDT